MPHPQTWDGSRRDALFRIYLKLFVAAPFACTLIGALASNLIPGCEVDEGRGASPECGALGGTLETLIFGGFIVGMFSLFAALPVWLIVRRFDDTELDQLERNPPPQIDGSSPEAFRSSFDHLLRSLPEGQRSLLRAKVARLHAAAIDGQPSRADSMQAFQAEALRQLLHCRRYSEIMNLPESSPD